MLPIRIVCSYDAKPMAERLVRLLGAEEHTAELSFGRPSLAYLNVARERGEIVVLIWSGGAANMQYMIDWALGIDASRRIEITRGSASPPLPGKHAPIDFTHWSGERGGAAWKSLHDRLRQIARASEPPKPPPKRAVMALGAASIVAVGAAAFVRIDEALHPATFDSNDSIAEAPMLDEIGLGGPLVAYEPISAGDVEVVRLARPAEIAPLDPLPPMSLTHAHVAAPIAYGEDPSMLQRLTALAAPLMPGESEPQR